MKHKMSKSHMKHDGMNMKSGKETMNHKGYVQGDMEPHVVDYQKPSKDYSQEGFSKTTEYMERQDAFQGKEAKEVEKQAYKGRYS